MKVSITEGVKSKCIMTAFKSLVPWEGWKPEMLYEASNTEMWLLKENLNTKCGPFNGMYAIVLKPRH